MKAKNHFAQRRNNFSGCSNFLCLSSHTLTPDFQLNILKKTKSFLKQKVILSFMTGKETIMIFSAHTDDFVIGAGGTILKYVQEGKKVKAVVFSLGEKSHPWLKEKVIRKVREDETINAVKSLGCDLITYDLKDTDIEQDYKRRKMEKEIYNLINKFHPSKIFTHNSEDPHPDHRAVHKITMDLFDQLKNKPEIYTYSVWNPVSFKTNYPILYVDVSSTFMTKLKALKQFPSQRFNAIYPLLILIFYRAIKEGLKIRKLFAESFYRIK